MTKFLSKSKYIVALLMAILLISPVALAGCGEPAITSLTVGLEGNTTNTVKANESYQITVTANTGATISNATFEVLKGNNYATVAGQTITIGNNAPSNAEIVIVASYNGVVSNELTLRVEQRQATSLNLALANGEKNIEPEGKYTLVVSSDIPDAITDANVSVIAGAENVILDGLSLTVREDAVPGSNVILQAQVGELKSNQLVLTVSHIEADSIIISNTQTQVYAGEIVELHSVVTPANATRPIEYDILTDNATVENGNMIIDSDLSAGSVIKVQAHIGDAVSQIVSFTVIPFEESDILGLVIDNNSVIAGTLTIDTSITSTTQNLGTVLYVDKSGETAAIRTQNIKYTVDNPEILIIDSAAMITPLLNGTTKVTASYGNHTDSVNVHVMMTPSVVYLPAMYEDRTVDYNYAANTVLPSFAPAIPTSNGCEDYTLNIVSGGVTVAQFNTVDGITTPTMQNDYITYDGSNLTVSRTGTYTINFESLSGCAVEKQSQSISICYNNGTNVDTIAEMQAACSDTNVAIINVTSDIIMSGGKENYRVIGSKEINGNGHKIDASGQIIGINEYRGDETSLFYVKPINDRTSYNFVFRDLDLIGNFGYWGVDQIYEVTQKYDPNLTKNDIENNLDRYWFNNFTHRTALFVDNELFEPDGTTYSVVTPYIKNINISNFHTGIKIYYAVDEIARTGSGRPAVKDLTMSNLFGDGITFEGSLITIENVTSGIMGGSPVAMNGPDKSDNAGEYRDQNAYTNIIGDINIDNPVDGTGLYLKYELGYIDAIAALMDMLKQGVASVINTVVSALVTQVSRPYQEVGDMEMVQKINDSVTNILQTQRVGEVDRDMFNLFYFTASPSGTMNISDKSQIVDFNEEFCLNGIDTTHKFVKVNFYDSLSQIDNPIFKVLISQYGDQLKPIEVIVGNFNYVAPNNA